MNDIEKTCKTCRDRKECTLDSYFDYKIEAEIYNIGESGMIEEIIKESLDTKEVFTYMQEQGIIKKNININNLKDDDTINQLLIEEIGNSIFSFLIRQIKGIKVDIKPKDRSENFSCSNWR